MYRLKIIARIKAEKFSAVCRVEQFKFYIYKRCINIFRQTGIAERQVRDFIGIGNAFRCKSCQAVLILHLKYIIKRGNIDNRSGIIYIPGKCGVPGACSHADQG